MSRLLSTFALAAPLSALAQTGLVAGKRGSFLPSFLDMFPSFLPACLPFLPSFLPLPACPSLLEWIVLWLSWVLQNPSF
jgi:hypothetical protein